MERNQKGKKVLRSDALPSVRLKMDPTETSELINSNDKGESKDSYMADRSTKVRDYEDELEKYLNMRYQLVSNIFDQCCYSQRAISDTDIKMNLPSNDIVDDSPIQLKTENIDSESIESIDSDSIESNDGESIEKIDFESIESIYCDPMESTDGEPILDIAASSKYPQNHEIKFQVEEASHTDCAIKMTKIIKGGENMNMERIELMSAELWKYLKDINNTCDCCLQKFLKPNIIKQAMYRNVCTFCNKNIEDTLEKNLKEHMKYHFVNSQHSCMKCGPSRTPSRFLLNKDKFMLTIKKVRNPRTPMPNPSIHDNRNSETIYSPKINDVEWKPSGKVTRNNRHVELVPDFVDWTTKIITTAESSLRNVHDYGKTTAAFFFELDNDSADSESSRLKKARMALDPTTNTDVETFKPNNVTNQSETLYIEKHDDVASISSQCYRFNQEIETELTNSHPNDDITTILEESYRLCRDVKLELDGISPTVLEHSDAFCKELEENHNLDVRHDLQDITKRENGNYEIKKEFEESMLPEANVFGVESITKSPATTTCDTTILTGNYPDKIESEFGRNANDDVQQETMQCDTKAIISDGNCEVVHIKSEFFVPENDDKHPKRCDSDVIILNSHVTRMASEKNNFILKNCATLDTNEAVCGEVKMEFEEKKNDEYSRGDNYGTDNEQWGGDIYYLETASSQHRQIESAKKDLKVYSISYSPIVEMTSQNKDEKDDVLYIGMTPTENIKQTHPTIFENDVVIISDDENEILSTSKKEDESSVNTKKVEFTWIDHKHIAFTTLTSEDHCLQISIKDSIRASIKNVSCGRCLENVSKVEDMSTWKGPCQLCFMCKFYFTKSSTFTKHLVGHMEEQHYKCYPCKRDEARVKNVYFDLPFPGGDNEKLDTASDLMFLMKFICEECEEEFHNLIEYQKHTIVHVPSFIRTPGCITNLIGGSEFFYRKTRTKNNTCRFCKNAFPNEAYVDEHAIIFHPYVLCDSCNTIFVMNERVLDDLSVLRNKFSVCAYCSKVFHSERCMKEHVIVSHAKVLCLECPLKLGNLYDLAQHRDRCDGSSCKYCEECNQTFATNFKFWNHLQKHRPVSKVYECRICSYPFRNYRDFQEHVYSYTNIIHCDVCDIFFSGLSTLKIHMKTNHPQITSRNVLNGSINVFSNATVLINWLNYKQYQQFFNELFKNK